MRESWGAELQFGVGTVIIRNTDLEIGVPEQVEPTHVGCYFRGAPASGPAFPRRCRYAGSETVAPDDQKMPGLEQSPRKCGNGSA